ncbi:MAG TPA: hypothetical protein VGJ07_07385 [Rugosimonospora sp.]|jgi:hypothetical protein
MSVIHNNTTLTPTKLELLTGWLPAQPWYVGTGHGPELTKVGGFRLDDPEGEVGIEFMAVTDGSGEESVTYQVPLTYRGAPCDSAAEGLIGTAEHGVLGRRWVYDGVHDQVLVAQLVALIQGGAEPQAQSKSDTPDPSVVSHPLAGALARAAAGAGAGVPVTGHTIVADGPGGTDLRVDTAGEDGTPVRGTVRVHRILRPEEPAGTPGATAGAGVTATWQSADGARVRGVFATAQHAGSDPARL